jgi:diguanylate cyclase (GGDEF)-like protein/PAS domain S-box-containing protein
MRYHLPRAAAVAASARRRNLADLARLLPAVAARADLQATADQLGCGLIVIAGDGRLAAVNALALRYLGLSRRPRDAATLLRKIGRHAIAGQTATTALIEIDGTDTTIEVNCIALEDGGLAVFACDISNERSAERALQQIEAEYRSVFENSVYGIYRDTLDGAPVRVNPALARLNGYASEAEHIAAVTARPANWYVDPGRAAEFMQTLRRDGRVKDFVSEVRRHATGEPLWVTENAWYVCDSDGTPLFIEGTIQDASERIASVAAIERQANTDSLTGVASRFFYLRKLGELTASGNARLALLSIDLDHFKEVNDILGHSAGDSVLQMAAARLREVAGGDALVARLGGDEFAILLQTPAAVERCEEIAAGAVAELRRPMPVNGHNLVVGGSIGVARFPDHADTAEQLLINADMALYKVKVDGRNGCRMFDYDLRSRLRLRKELEAELRSAIARDELDLYYQPIVTASGTEVTGYEALMRWNHPSRGFLLPSSFIPIAEAAGLMTALGNWAIGRACAQAALLPAPLTVSVNVSPNQFRSAEILSELRRSLDATGLDPARLVLEVTETVMVSSETVARPILDHLQDLGVGLSLDDFGTGYSSLNYLQRSIFSKVKIDRSFVAGIEKGSPNLAIIRAVIGIGRDLGIDVIAADATAARLRQSVAAPGAGQRSVNKAS